MTTTPNPPPPARTGRAPSGSPLDLLIILGRHRARLALWPLGAAAAALVVSLLWPQTFTAVTRILPPQQGQSTAAAMLGQLGGGLASLAGGSLGIKNPSDLYVGMLKSQTVANALIERFKLKEAYGEALLVDARRELAVNSRFASDKSGIITIEADAHDPALAADLANAYVEQLHKLTGTLAVTDAAQRRAFFEQQLQLTKEKLAESELKLRQGIERGGLVSVDAQGRAAIETGARLRAQISAKEIQLGAMRSYATPANPDLQRAEKELAAMRQELERLETGSPDGATPRGADARGVENIRLVREVKYNEVMFELLARQYEMARVDEAKEAPIVQVLDRAAVPERKSGPRRGLIVVGAALLGLFVGLLSAFVKTALERLDPVQRERLDALRAAWSRRKA